ncbi:MAG: signal peptidase II [Candidatus Eiseniibacteriota bacterium]
MRRSFGGLFLISLAVLALDQSTKRWASQTLQNAPPMRVLGSLVQFSYTRNSGVAFGIGAGLHFPYWIFSALAAVGIVALLVLRPAQSTPRRVALALVLGGAIGNLIDRVRFGEVVDFILLSWRHWQFPIFNVADSAVTIGVVLFALVWSGGARDAGASDGGVPGERDASG